MNTHEYSRHKQWIFEEAYHFFAFNSQRGSDTLSDCINRSCFADRDFADSINEEEAAVEYMWFYLRRLHGLPIDNSDTRINSIINYLEGALEFLPTEEKEDIEDDIKALKSIKKWLSEVIVRNKFEFLSEMYKMDNKLRVNETFLPARYGKCYYDNWLVAKNILISNASNAKKFVCLSAYYKMCMYYENKPNDEFHNILSEFLSGVSEDEIIESFVEHCEHHVKDFIMFLKRFKDIQGGMSKDSFLDILEQKGIAYNAGNYVDRIEIDNVHISLNTTVGNDTVIPCWHIKLVDAKCSYTIAQFDNRNDAYIFFIEKYLERMYP